MESNEDAKKAAESANEPDVKTSMETEKAASEPKEVVSGKRARLLVWILAAIAVLGVASGISGWISVWQKNDENDVLKVTLDQKEQTIADLKNYNMENSNNNSAEPADDEWRSLVLTESGWLNRPETAKHVRIKVKDYFTGYKDETRQELWQIGAYVERGDDIECDNTNDGVSSAKVKSKTIFVIDWDAIRQYYDNEDLSKTGEERIDISDQIDPYEVVEILAAPFGQAASGSRLLFLMKDGTVEYISLFEIARTGEVKSAGKIPGVEKVVKFYLSGDVDVTTACVGGGYDVYAQRADGKYYDLAYSLRDN